MGAFIDQISFKGVNPRAVADVIRDQMPNRRCFITLRAKPWVTVFPELSEEDATSCVVVEIGSRVSRQCRCAAIGFQVTDSDFLSWWVFGENGDILAESVADMDKGEVSDEEAVGLAGDLSQIAKLGSESAITTEQVTHLFRLGRQGILEVTVSRIGDLLGIEYARLVYDDVLSSSREPKLCDSDIYDWKREFLFVGPSY